MLTIEIPKLSFRSSALQKYTGTFEGSFGFVSTLCPRLSGETIRHAIFVVFDLTSS